MKRIFALSALSLAAIAGAAVIVTQSPGPHELRLGPSLLGQFPSHEACIAAIPAPDNAASVEYTCNAVTKATAVGVCDDVPQPAFEMRLDNYECPATAKHTHALIEVYGVERQAYPDCSWKEVGRRVLSCNDPVKSSWTSPDSEIQP
jgi:hypothetical protein